MNVQAFTDMSIKGKKRAAIKNSDEGVPLLSASGPLSLALLSHHDLDQMFTQMVRQIKKIFRARSCGIFLLNDRGILEFEKGLGLSRRFQSAFDSQVSPKLNPEILNRIYPRISNDTLVDYKKTKSLRDLMRRENIRKEAAVPLKVENRLIGILSIGRDSSYPDFSEKDLQLLNMVGNQIALAASNAKLCQLLKKSSEVYGNLIEGAPDSIVAVDLKGNITYCNKATEILTGYAKEKLIGKHFSRMSWTKNKDISHTMKLFKALQSGKKVAPFEIEVRHKDGKPYWIEVHISRIKEKGKVIGFQVNAKDITDRRQVEESSKQKVLELNSFINNIPDMAWLKDDKSRFIALNKAFGEVVGMKPETLIGQTCEACFGAKAGKEFRKDDLKVMRGRKQVSIEEKISDSGGKELWLETIKSPIFGESGKVVGTVGIARNVTERKRTEDQLGKLSRAVEQSPSIVMITDTKGTIEYVNPKFTQITGYTTEEIIGTNALDLGEQPSEEQKQMWNTITSGGEWRGEFHNKKKTGELYWEFASISSIKNRKGLITHFLKVAEDITERKRAQEALIRGERIATERARLLNDLRNLDRIDDVLTRVCEAVRDSELFERAVMTLHKPGGRICHLGQVGLPSNVVKRARQAPPIDQNLRAQVTSNKFRISDSFFIPVEAGVAFSKTGRYVPQKRKKSVGDGWQPGDELFVPLRDFSGKIMGYLSVDTPPDGSRPDVKTIQALEMLVEAAAARVREVEAQKALKREHAFSQSIIGTANSLIVCLDADAKITVFNKECERVTGYRHEKVLGKRWPELFLPPDHHHAKWKSFPKWVRAHPRDQYEGPIVTRSGEIRTILWSNTAILGSGKKDVIAIAIGQDITGRKRAEEALQISQERYKLCTRAANVGVWDWDIKTNKFYIDPNIKEILGYKDEEIPNDIEVWVTYVHPDDREPVMAVAQACLDGKRPEYVFEHRMRHKDGSVRWILSRGSVIRDAKGNAVRMVGTDTDITERKQGEEALRKSEDQLRLITDALPVLISYVDSGQRYRFNNKAYEEWFGHSRTEVYGKHIKEVLGKPAYKAIKRYVETVLSGQEATFESVISYKDAGTRYVNATYVPHFGKQGEVRGFFALVSDLTERKRAEEQLRESEQRYRSVVDNIGIGVSLISPDMEILSLNNQMKKWFPDIDVSKKPICYRSFNNPPRKGVCSYCPTYKTLKDGQVHESITETPAGDEIRNYRIISSPIKDSAGKIIAAIEMVEDITERKKAEEALQESEIRYRTLVQHIPAITYIAALDEVSTTLYISPQIEKIIGISPDDYKADPDFWRKHLHSDDRERVLKEVAEAHATSQPFVSEYRMLTCDGRVVWIRDEAVVVKDETGKPLFLQGVMFDITERKKVEEALRESEGRFRTISTTAKDAIVMLDNEGNISYWNPAAEEIFGYLSQEVAGKELHVLLPPKRYQEAYRKGFSKFKKTGQGVAVGKMLELEAIKKDGTEFPIEISLSAIKIKGKWHAVGILRDITERKKAEEALRESEGRYRSLFEDSPIPLWEEDFSDVKTFIESLRVKGVKDFRKHFENHPEAVVKCATMVKVIDVNNASLELFKAKSKQALQRSLGNTFSEESYDAFREELTAISRGKNTFETEAITQTLKGDKKHVVVRWSVAPGNEKTLSKVLVSISDITELKRAREQNLLLETSKALSRTLRLDQVLKIGTEKMAKALKADRCSVALLDKSDDSAAIRYVFIKEDTPTPMLPGKRTPPDKHFSKVKDILLTKGYLEVKNVKAVPMPTSIRNYFRRVGMKSFLAIPLIVDKKLFGVFHIGSVKKLRSFAPEEISLAQTIANQVTVAIQNALLIEDLKKKHSQIIEQSKTLERQYQEQGILMKVSRELSKTLDSDRLLEIATKEAAQALQVDRCAASLAFPEEGYAEIRSIYVKGGKSVTHLLGYKLYVHHLPQAKEMFGKRKSINIPNIYHLPDKSFAKKYFTKEGIKSALFSPMVHGKKLVGFFTLSTTKDFKTFTEEETKLAQTIADQTAVAIENARLLELVRKSSEDLKRLSSQLINVQEEERKKLAQELHDEIGQTLFAMKMNLDVTKKNLPPDIEKLEDIKNRLGDTDDLLSDTIDRIRNLTTDLRPSMLDDFGLIPALKWYIETFSKRTNIEVYLKIKNLKARLSSEVDTTFYRITQEALTNVAKHAQATKVLIRLGQENSFAFLSVEDNGTGFDTKSITPAKDRLGLFSIKERVELLDGEFEIRSRTNKGTKLSVKIPLAERSV